jgi:hypothetical protein
MTRTTNARIAVLAGRPLQLTGFLPDSVTSFMWLPMAAFEAGRVNDFETT